MEFEENFLRLTVTVLLQKKEDFKNVNFLIIFFQSISYNNVIDTKQIYFSPTFLKPCVHITHNNAGVVGDPKYYQQTLINCARDADRTHSGALNLWILLWKNQKSWDLQIYCRIRKTMKKLQWIPNAIVNTSALVICWCLCIWLENFYSIVYANCKTYAKAMLSKFLS